MVDKKSDSINSQRTPKGELWLSIPAPVVRGHDFCRVGGVRVKVGN